MTLEITDFAEPDEKGDAIALWETQVDELKRRLVFKWPTSSSLCQLNFFTLLKNTIVRLILLSLPKNATDLFSNK